MGYALLSLAIGFGILGTNLLKLSVGFTRVGIGITSLACYGVSFYLMALSYQKLPLSVAESIWAALGIIAATSLLGQFVYHERVALAQWLGVCLIIVGVLLVSFNNSN